MPLAPMGTAEILDKLWPISNIIKLKIIRKRRQFPIQLVGSRIVAVLIFPDIAADIMRILKKKGEVKVFAEDYKVFSAGKSDIKKNQERLFLCKCYENEKEIIPPALNYTGGKGCGQGGGFVLWWL